MTADRREYVRLRSCGLQHDEALERIGYIHVGIVKWRRDVWAAMEALRAG